MLLKNRLLNQEAKIKPNRLKAQMVLVHLDKLGCQIGFIAHDREQNIVFYHLELGFYLPYVRADRVNQFL